MDFQEKLDKTVEQLYHTFISYELHKHIEGCPCCISEAEQKLIRSKPLRTLSEDDLSKYASKALTTWGNEDDFRHFLPRLFELQTKGQANLCDPEIVYSKLNYADWRSWPLKEQEAIESYFDVMWKFLLTSSEPEPFYDQAGDYLCAIGQAVDNLQDYLKVWLELGPRAIRHLYAFTERNSSLGQGQLNSAFWQGRQKQMQQVVAWVQSNEVQHALYESEW